MHDENNNNDKLHGCVFYLAGYFFFIFSIDRRMWIDKMQGEKIRNDLRVCRFFACAFTILN